MERLGPASSEAGPPDRGGYFGGAFVRGRFAAGFGLLPPCPLPLNPECGGRALGGRIRVAREATGLSEETLARQLGLDPGTLAAWERDEVRRPYPRIRRIFERWLVSVGAERTAYGTENSALGTCQERR
jgi:DNA-binding XRE family transcriptional regulator